MDAAYIHRLLEELRALNSLLRPPKYRQIVELSSAAVPHLISAYKSEEEMQKTNIVKMMGEIKDERSLEVFIDASQQPSWSLRMAAMHGMGMLGNPVVKSYLLAGLEDEEWMVREAALDAFDWLGGLESLGEQEILKISRLLQDPKWETREACANVLGQTSSVWAIDPLINALADNENEVVLQVVLALVQIGEQAVAPLVEALNRRSAKVRIGSLHALGRIGKPARTACDVINELMKDTATEDVYIEAEWAKSQIGCHE
jgi:HEAT repeat protein